MGSGIAAYGLAGNALGNDCVLIHLLSTSGPKRRSTTAPQAQSLFGVGAARPAYRSVSTGAPSTRPTSSAVYWWPSSSSSRLRTARRTTIQQPTDFRARSLILCHLARDRVADLLRVRQLGERERGPAPVDQIGEGDTRDVAGEKDGAFGTGICQETIIMWL
jgi:hypothetical protein